MTGGFASGWGANNKILAISYLGLRKAIGYIGLGMPIVVMLCAYFKDKVLLDSVSASYYTSARDVFVGSLAAIGTFLFFHVDTDKLDQVLARIAGLSGIGIGLLPMEQSYEALSPDDVGKLQSCAHGPLGFHIYAVGVFFAVISYMALFRFTRVGAAGLTPEKEIRNRIYVVCGIVMLLAFATIGVDKLLGQKRPIFWPETFAIAAFSIAWLVKGQIVLKDSRPRQLKPVSELV